MKRFLVFFFFLAVALVAPLDARADCCSGSLTVTSSNCCNIFGCNCDGPCTNFGCGGVPTSVGGYCGVVSGYYTLIYNGACAYTTQGAAEAGAPKEALKQEGPVMMLSGAKPQERFNAIDTSRDGSISFEEAQAWVKKQPGGAAMSTEDLQAQFKRADKNGDGKIEPGEFDFTLAKK
ncbi:MAG TPA: EF-hand domain-containing protein [Chthoniobacterales bacterium]|nr:EF-hand domain-containing protein [Chthoniobacterales bacterium]